MGPTQFCPSDTFTISVQPPPGTSVRLSLPETYSRQTNRPTDTESASNSKSTGDDGANPPIFNDAIQVRAGVFIDEQKCSPEGEIDDDDPRSWQWVIYASRTVSGSNTSTSSSTGPAPAAAAAAAVASSARSTIPVAVIRLVPPPQPPHEALLAHSNDAPLLPRYDWTHEPCIKLTRVAVLPEYRGLGLGRRLVQTALDWAVTHAEEIDDATRELASRFAFQGPSRDVRSGPSTGQAREEQKPDWSPAPWRGLVLVHAQVDVEAMYRGMGFVRDDELGRWDEEGIEHVGMFRRVEIRSKNLQSPFGVN